MKERPILFSGPMVCAILEGRKTQTRRIVKPQPKCDVVMLIGNESASKNHAMTVGEGEDTKFYRCPYGVSGDRLWVRETWTYYHDHTDERNTQQWRYGYKADQQEEIENQVMFRSWKPSIHMPRLASRITLKVVSVRVERVQEISTDDALSEGVHGVSEYSALWREINGPGSWEYNPWVWVIEFRRIK